LRIKQIRGISDIYNWIDKYTRRGRKKPKGNCLFFRDVRMIAIDIQGTLRSSTDLTGNKQYLYIDFFDRAQQKKNWNKRIIKTEANDKQKRLLKCPIAVGWIYYISYIYSDYFVQIPDKVLFFRGAMLDNAIQEIHLGLPHLITQWELIISSLFFLDIHSFSQPND